GPDDIAGLARPPDEGRHAAAHRDARRFDLRAHPPGADQRPGAALDIDDLLRYRRDALDSFGARIDARVLRIETVRVGEAQEPLRLDEIRDEGRQVVVVAELQPFDGYGVVLVNDRDDLLLQQLFDRHRGVLNAEPVGEVEAGQQNLG